jgi:AmmeMemoRadiSam system protein A
MRPLAVAVQGGAGLICLLSRVCSLQAMEPVLRSEDPIDLIELARRAIDLYVSSGRVLSIPKATAPSSPQRAGVFVSVKQGDRLRGCIGTIHPTQDSVAGEVIVNAIQAVSADPRFPPVREDELEGLTVSVDVLSLLEPCTASDLDPDRYGVLVESNGRRGLLLPGLPGVDTVRDQVSIACRKAGIPDSDPVSLFRFTVKRQTE